MIRICLKITENTYRFEASGHADFNPGNDIVCAAVSCLTYTLAKRLKQVGCKIPSDVLGCGCASFSFSNNIRTREILKTVKCGFEGLSEEYPENVSLEGFDI